MWGKTYCEASLATITWIGHIRDNFYKLLCTFPILISGFHGKCPSEKAKTDLRFLPVRINRQCRNIIGELTVVSRTFPKIETSTVKFFMCVDRRSRGNK